MLRFKRSNIIAGIIILTITFILLIFSLVWFILLTDVVFIIIASIFLFLFCLFVILKPFRYKILNGKLLYRRIKLKEIEIVSINDIIISLYVMMPQYGGPIDLYETNKHEKKIKSAYIFLLKEFDTSKLRRQKFIDRFFVKSNIAREDRIFDMYFTCDLLDKLIKEGYLGNIYILQSIYDDRKEDLENIFSKYNYDIEKVVLFS